jgi:L-ascorbate metabolism protein UlaG (beta-lactamase superfamily)
VIGVKATFLGHACWLLEAEGVGLIIDPFLTGNPQAARKAEDVRCQYVFLTHGHDDHVGDAAAIAKRNDALVISTFEVAARVGEAGARTHGMHVGGTYRFPFGKLRITPAFHGSGAPGGHAAGLLTEFFGKRVYHAGDTSLFGDMKLIPEVWGGADLALLPIGGNFTMDADDAVVAARWIRPGLAVPMHYGTWPPIQADPDDWVRRVRAEGIEARVVRPGESVEL